LLARQVLELVLLQQVVAQALEQEALLVAVVVPLAEQEVLLLVVVVLQAEQEVLPQAVAQVLAEPLQEAAQELEVCLLRKDLLNLLSHLIFS